MKFTQELCPIIKKTTLAKGIFDVTILAPVISQKAVCGQFVNIKVDGFMLRRPISICGIDKDKNTLRIVFEVRGEGTKKLSDIKEGSLLDVVGPLGHGFTLEDSSKKAVVICGGIGTPPMLPIAKFYGENATVISGFRSANAVILQDDFADTRANVFLCTDDGTAGEKGFVTAKLEEALEKNDTDIIYACGPAVMLSKVAKMASEKGIYCEVSMEERMGCGVGACLVCACKTVKNGQEYMSHVCKDGPVFKAEEVFPN